MNVICELLLLDDLDEALAAHHVDQVASPRRVDAARFSEDIVLDLIDATVRIEATNL